VTSGSDIGWNHSKEGRRWIAIIICGCPLPPQHFVSPSRGGA
jgi:hypothetical protein